MIGNMRTKKYRIGFSPEGLIGSLLVILPNILWAIMPSANNVLVENSVDIPSLDLIMNICRFALIALLVLVVNKSRKEDKKAKHLLVSAIVCLLVYYVSWALFYGGTTNPWLFIIGLALAPSVLFVSLALWLGNKPALIPAVIFTVLHVTVVGIGFL